VDDSVDRLSREWIEAVPEADIGEYPIFARVMHAARLYENAMSRTAASHGMSYRDIYLLMALRRAGRAVTPTELIEELSITMAAITKRIGRLEDSGFVSRRRDSDDGRSIRIELTARGRALVDDDIRAHRQPEFRIVNEEFTKDESALLTTLLRRLLARLENIPVIPSLSRDSPNRRR
jgi:DNA-binding MarR family transcriptional regulator